ncbi:hypothetical protein FraQA3DRAFT_1985 [Frankia sp. QA3]|nr:hypothetical protein FraQA3DRAFT_1985 [Frankia sp. QA3]
MLHHVRELGKSPEPGVVVLGSWLDRTGPLAPSVCVVYKNAKHPHLADKLIGIRWPVSESTGCGEGEVQEPREWAFALFSYHIEEPLGSTVGRLRYDAHGIGWFGYAVDPLPPIPEDLLRLLASDKRG